MLEPLFRRSRAVAATAAGKPAMKLKTEYKRPVSAMAVHTDANVAFVGCARSGSWLAHPCLRPKPRELTPGLASASLQLRGRRDPGLRPRRKRRRQGDGEDGARGEDAPCRALPRGRPRCGGRASRPASPRSLFLRAERAPRPCPGPCARPGCLPAHTPPRHSSRADARPLSVSACPGAALGGNTLVLSSDAVGRISAWEWEAESLRPACSGGTSIASAGGERQFIPTRLTESCRRGAPASRRPAARRGHLLKAALRAATQGGSSRPSRRSRARGARW